MNIFARIRRECTGEQARRLFIDYTQIFANLCGPISILVAIFVFGVQRSDQKVQIAAQLEAQRDQDRRTTAMQYVMLKHQDSFLQPAAKIAAGFTEQNVIEYLEDLQGNARHSLLAEQTEKIGIANFSTMADLYRAVIACRATKACDAGILDAAYRVEITQFYCLSREYALPELAKKLNDPEYPTPIARYAQRCEG